MVGLASCLGAIAAILLAAHRRLRRCLPLPPGPPARGLLGNVRDIPKSRQWIAYTELAQKYGPVVHLRVLYRHIVVLNTLEAVTDLLDRRSAIYSDRPRFHMLELIGWGWNVSLMPYGSMWREHRRVLHQFFTEDASRNYHELQTVHNNLSLHSLLETPDAFRQHVYHLSASNILSIAYGIEVASKDDPWVQLVEGGVDSFGAGAPGTYAIDWIPALRYLPAWFPGATFKRRAIEWRKSVDNMINAPVDYVKSQITTGKSVSSLAADVLRYGVNGRPIAESIVRNSAGVAYAAGSETTSSLLLFFMLSMVLYPEAQRKSQDEIDRVIGPRCLPNFSDRGSLPYVEALMLEVVRMHPVLPAGFPRRVMQDDEYRGMRIPKGATVIPNVWAITHGQRHYPDPFRFDPERYLKDGAIDSDVLDPRVPVFGWGRRECIGKSLADSTVWLFIATVLSCFDIRRKRDQNGHKVPFDPEIRSGLNVSPEPFPCDISPRSHDAERLVLLAAAAVP